MPVPETIKIDVDEEASLDQQDQGDSDCNKESITNPLRLDHLGYE